MYFLALKSQQQITQIIYLQDYLQTNENLHFLYLFSSLDIPNGDIGLELCIKLESITC